MEGLKSYARKYVFDPNIQMLLNLVRQVVSPLVGACMKQYFCQVIV